MAEKDFFKYKEFFVKKYEDILHTQKEFESMKFLYSLMQNMKNESFTYRSVKVHKADFNLGLIMEYIIGEPLNDVFKREKNYSLFYHPGCWLGFYSNNFYDKNKVGWLHDFTAQNILYTNNHEIVVIDQALLLTEISSVESIIAYFILRQELEQIINLNITFKHIAYFFRGFTDTSFHSLDKIKLLKSILTSFKRIKKNHTQLVFKKRFILKRIMEISVIKIFLFLLFQKN